MARTKRTSPAVEFATTRISALASIDTALDLGNGKTLVAYTTRKEMVKGLNDSYNTELSKLDGLLNDLKDEEKKLQTLSAEMLAAVGVKYSKDSSEYEKAGGIRSSERKRSVRKPKTTSSPN